MRKIFQTIVFISIITLFGFTPSDGEKTEKRVKEKSSEKELNVLNNMVRTDIQNSVLEFIGDLDINPDTCYIPFKSSPRSMPNGGKR
jgi:hypothetical protein